MQGDRVEAVATRDHRAEHQRRESYKERQVARAYQEAEKYLSQEEKSTNWNRPQNDTYDRQIVDKGSKTYDKITFHKIKKGQESKNMLERKR